MTTTTKELAEKLRMKNVLVDKPSTLTEKAAARLLELDDSNDQLREQNTWLDKKCAEQEQEIERLNTVNEKRLEHISLLKQERDAALAEVEQLHSEIDSNHALARAVIDVLNVPTMHDAPAAIERLKLAQQGEPVAWYDDEMDEAYTATELDGGNTDGLTPLYAAPQSDKTREALKLCVEALERVHSWAENQSDAQSKGGHATFDLMMLREQRDNARAALAAAQEVL